MNSYYPLALLLARQERAAAGQYLAHSALPTAPRVTDEKMTISQAWRALRERLATLLHRIAWAIEPKIE